jgi:hypothetical protein
VPADSPLGEHYRRLGAEGHRYYRHAHFFTGRELDALLTAAGFHPGRRRSALLAHPSVARSQGSAVEGLDPAAGFQGLLALP